MLLIAHFVLLTSFANGFVIRNSLNSSSDAQIPTNHVSKSNFNPHHYHHQTTVMPSKSVTYELTVINDPIPELNQTQHHALGEQTKTNHQATKTNHQTTKTNHQETKTNHQTTKNNYESPKTNYESSKTNYESSKTHYEPSKTHYESSKTHYEPSKTHELNKTHHESTKTNFESTKTSHHQPSKTSQLDQLDRLSQEQIAELNQVKYLNQLNKVNISPINIISTISSIGHVNDQQSQVHSTAGGVKGQINQFSSDPFVGIKGAQQAIHVSDPFSLKGQQQNQISENNFGTKSSQQNQINNKFDTKGGQQIHNDAFSTKRTPINSQFGSKGQQIQLNDQFGVKGQPIQLNDPFGIKGHQSEINNPFGIKGAQQQLSDLFGIKGVEPSKTGPDFVKQHNEVRDGFVVLTSAHNSRYPAPMYSRNMLSQLGSTDQNDFYQKYYTSTSLVTIRPIVKEYHQQQVDQQVYEKLSQQKIPEQQHQISEQSEVKGPQNYHSLNSSTFLGNSAFLPEDKPEEDTELDASEEHKPPLVNEFNTLNDDGSGKSFFELFGHGITSYNLHKMNLSSSTSKPVISEATHPTDHLSKPAYLSAYDNKTLFNGIDSTTTTSSPVFDLTAEDSNYRPFISNDPDPIQNLPKAHGTRPGQPLTSYELFKEYPLINNSNIIINQFHSTPSNWSKPAESANKNQTKVISIHPINNPSLSLPTELNFLHPFLANYSAISNATSFIRPTIITEFANEFFTNLTGGHHYQDHHDLDNSDSSGIAAFFNFTTSTQAPIGTLDRNLFDIPLPSVWNSVANQLTSTTLSPLPVHSPPTVTHHPFGNSPYSNSSLFPAIHVSSSDLITLKRNHTNQAKPFPTFKPPFYSTTTLSPNLNRTLQHLSHIITSNNAHRLQHFGLPPSSTPSSVLYSATQTPVGSQPNSVNNKNSLTAATSHIPFTTTSTSTPSTITPEVYHWLNNNLNGNSRPKQPIGNFIDGNMTTLTNNHNIDETIFYNNPLRLATNPKIMHPLTLLIMSYLASKSSIGANLITRNDQPSNSTAASNGGLVDWLRTGRRRKRKNAPSSSRSNKQVSRQQKQRNTNSNSKLPSVAGLPASTFQIAPVITLQDVLLSNHLTNKLAGAANSLAQAFPTPISPLANPLFFPTTKPPYGTTADRFPAQMIYETKRDRPSSNFMLEDFLNDNGYTAEDYEEEIRPLLEQHNHLRSNSKHLNNDSKLSNKNSGSSSSSYRTHRNGQQNVNSRNSRTPPEISGSSGSNINTPTANSVESDRDRGHSSTNTPAPRCDRFTSSICVDDFEYPEAAIIEEIDRKRSLFQLLYSEVKGDTWSQVDGLTRSQEQALSWDQFGSNGFANETSNESYSSSDRSPHRNSYITMDDDMMNNDQTAFRFSSLVKDSNHNGKKSGFICSSEILYGRPKLAKNTKNQWKVIVNAGSYTQTVRMEKCLQPNKACSLVQSAAVAMGATSRCAQVNAFHRLMVFEKGRGFYIDTFRIPSSCACYVQHKSKTTMNAEFDSEEISSNPQRKTNRKRTDGNQQTSNKAEIDRQTSNRLQHLGLSNLPTSLFNQPFILSDLNGLQRSKLQTLFPAFGQRAPALSSANNLISSKLSPNIELRPLFLKNGGTLLASLVPLTNSDNLKPTANSNTNANNSLIERLSISGSLTPAMLEQQQREISQMILDFIRLNANAPKTSNDQFKMINLEDLIKTHLSLAQVTPNHLLEQLNNDIFNPARLNEVIKNANRRKNTSKNVPLNTDSNQKILGLLVEDKNLKNPKLKTLPVKLVQAVPITALNNQLVYGQRFVDKRKSGIAQMMANKGNYSNLSNNLLNSNLLNNNLLNAKTPLIFQRDNALSLGTPLTALKIMNPGSLITQSPAQAAADSKEKGNDEEKDESGDDSDEDHKIVEEFDIGNMLGEHLVQRLTEVLKPQNRKPVSNLISLALGDMEDQEDKEDGKQGGEMYAESGNKGESSEDPNTSKTDSNAGPNDHSVNEERFSNNELNEDDKENASHEPNDHERTNEFDDSKGHNYPPPSNHLDTNSSLFTFENVSNGPRRKAFNRLNSQLKSNNNSFVSVSGFGNRHDRNNFDEFRNTFKETIGYATETSLTNRPHKYDEEHYSPQHDQNALHPSNEENSRSTSTTLSYLDEHNANEWSGSSSSSTVFTPSRAFKHKYNSTSNTTALPAYSTSNKRKITNEDPLPFGYRKPHRTFATGEQTNQLVHGSVEQTSNQDVDRLAIEESENDLRNQTLSGSSNNGRRPVNDRTISELLSEKVNFNYHPILDFINQPKD